MAEGKGRSDGDRGWRADRRSWGAARRSEDEDGRPDEEPRSFSPRQSQPQPPSVQGECGDPALRRMLWSMPRG